MRVAIRATEDAIIRLLREGKPLPSAIINSEEDTRLPVFQNIKAVPVKDYGIDGAARIVVACGRKDVWFVDIKRRGGRITEEESQTFLKMRDKLQEHHKSQKVTGWLVTTGKFEPEAQQQIREQECFSTAGAAKR